MKWLLSILIVARLEAQVFGSLVPSADYYVDQGTGSDSNPGSLSQPFLTCTKAASVATTGKTIAVKGAAGYDYREQCTLGAANVALVGYGTAQPLLDGSDLISVGAWSKTGGFTNIYQATVTTDNQSGNFLRIWENGTGMTMAASQAALDSAPGYWISNNGNLSGASQTVYVHATGDGNPASNGNTYEYNHREYGVFSGSRAVVSNIHTRRNYTNNGSFEVGASSFLTDITAEDGTKHNMLVHTGTYVNGAILSNAYYNGQSLILLVFNDNTPNYEGLTFRRVTVSMPTYTVGSTGIEGHTNSGGNFGALVYDTITATNLQGALDDIGCSSVTLKNSTITGGQTGLNMYSQAGTITGTTISATGQALAINGAATVTVSGSSLSSTVTNQGIVRTTAGSVALSISSTTLTNSGAGSFGIESTTGTGNSFTGSGITFVFTSGAANAYKLAGYSGWTSDNNAFPSGSTGSTNINNSWVSWANTCATFGQECHSTH